MRLLEINLENYRNIRSANLSFSTDRILFLGKNGQGKTNLLEAIGLSSSLRSFRRSSMEGIIKEGEKECRLFFRFLGDEGDESEILLGFSSRGKKMVEVDGEPVRKLGDFLGSFPAVCLSSRDFRLVRESPSDRRKWLDLMLSSSFPGYLSNLQKYHRALRERNALLKTGAGKSELSAYENLLAPVAAFLVQAREKALTQLVPLLTKIYGVLCENRETATIRYQPDKYLTTKDDWESFLTEQRTRDLQFGNTRHGPHRDDFSILLNEADARIYASEGQQRGLVLAIRLAEYSYLHQQLQKIPILVADDVLSELDQSRRDNFRKLLPPQAQVFASGTTYPSDHDKEIWETFRVDNGSFSPEILKP